MNIVELRAIRCPKCGSKAVKRGKFVHAAGTVQRYRCKRGHWFTKPLEVEQK